MADLRPRVLLWTRDKGVRDGFASDWLNLEVMKFPKVESTPEPERGPHAVKLTRIPGEFSPRVPLDASSLTLELAVLWSLHDELRTRRSEKEPIPMELETLLIQAIALNRTVWRDATLAEARAGVDRETVGAFILRERVRERDLQRIKLDIHLQKEADLRQRAVLPELPECWSVLIGGVFPHAIQSALLVIDFGLSSFQSWAPCKVCAGITGPCECHYCMHHFDPAAEKDPDLDALVKEDPSIAQVLHYSTASGWGPRGDLTAIKRANPNLTAYGARLELVFGRQQIESANRRFDGWWKPRRSGLRLGARPRHFDEPTMVWIAQRKADLRSLREVHSEYLQRGMKPTLTYDTFSHRFYRTLKDSVTERGVSPAPD